jgi:hypothetical protein
MSGSKNPTEEEGDEEKGEGEGEGEGEGVREEGKEWKEEESDPLVIEDCLLFDFTEVDLFLMGIGLLSLLSSYLLSSEYGILAGDLSGVGVFEESSSPLPPPLMVVIFPLSLTVTLFEIRLLVMGDRSRSGDPFGELFFGELLETEMEIGDVFNEGAEFELAEITESDDAVSGVVGSTSQDSADFIGICLSGADDVKLFVSPASDKDEGSFSEEFSLISGEFAPFWWITFFGEGADLRFSCGEDGGVTESLRVVVGDVEFGPREAADAVVGGTSFRNPT